MRANLATLKQRLERTEPPSVVPPRRGRGLQPDERPEWSCGAAWKGTAPDARPPLRSVASVLECQHDLWEFLGYS